MALVTDLSIIRIRSKKNEAENWQFRSFLKGTPLPERRIDSLVHSLYRKVSSEIDCRSCANCCRELQPHLDRKDIERLSKPFHLSVAQFQKACLVRGEESKRFVFSRRPCPLLKENLCLYYAYRPEGCVSYPHLHKKDFNSRLINVIESYPVCPIVFNVYESLKNEIWPHRQSRHFRDIDQ
jgi:Fe-S-cluster containining protein